MKPTSAASAEKIDRRTWMLCWVIVLGAFASGLDSSIVNVGMDSIGADLHSPLNVTQWTASGYLLALAVSLPAAAWMARRFGPGRLWLTSLTAFTIASALCALAPTIETLIAARALQGLSGGLLIPTGQTILGQAVGPQRLGRVMGTLGIAVSAAPALGSLLSGAILHVATWPWLFFVNVPIGLLALALGRRLVPLGAKSATADLDKTGLVLITIGMPALVYSTSRWGEAGRFSVDAAIAGVVAVMTLALFALWARRSPKPLLNLRLYSNAGFTAGAATALFSGALIFGSGVLFALYFILGKGQSPLMAGVSVIGAALATAATAPLTGLWVDRKGPAPAALTGGVLAALSVPGIAIVSASPSPWTVQPLLITFGIAVSLVSMPSGIAAYRAVTEAELPDAITQINILQRIGGSLGGAICAVLVASSGADLTTGLRHGFYVLSVASIGAMLIARATIRNPNSPNVHKESL